MGFFQKAGRKVEKLKQSATGNDGDDGCPACDTAVPETATECPECGATLDEPE